MKKNRKTLLGLILVALVVVAGYFAWRNGHEKTPSDKEKIKIGVILPLTGGGAIYGEDLKKGIDLAFAESPIKDKFELLFEDDAASPKDGVNALNKLIAQDVSIVVGAVMSSVANAMLPIANKNKTLLLSPKATDPKLAADDYFYRIWPTDSIDGKISATYICDSLRLSKIAIFYPNGDYGVGITRVFTQEAERRNAKIVYSQGYDASNQDFRTQLQKIKEAKPDVLFLPSYIKELLPILKQINELECNFFISGVSSYNEKSVVNSASKLTDRIFFTYPIYTSSNASSFSSSFNVKFGTIPNAFSAAGYDSFKLIEAAVRDLGQKGEAINGTTLRGYFQTMKPYKGVTGTLQFDPNGDAAKEMRVIWLKNIKN